MGINNYTKLTGNIVGAVRFIENAGKKPFASFKLAVNDSYKDKDGNWQNNETTTWLEVLAFSPKLMANLRGFKENIRVTIEGTLSQREFETNQTTSEGKIIKKYETNVIASKVEIAELPKKTSTEDAA